ncbi:MAG: NHL repeat-containing protein [Elusimicrobia bacterium]|nr:NHL repeat-containing protein [Candidatus Liberimonas magnetica]
MTSEIDATGLYIDFYDIKLQGTDNVGNSASATVCVYSGEPEKLDSWALYENKKLNKKVFEPAYIARDLNGNTYVTENHFSRIIKFNSAGEVVSIFGGPVPNGYKGDRKIWRGNWRGRVPLLSPEGITVDLNGNIYVADSSLNRIIKLDPNGEVLMQIGSCRESSEYRVRGLKSHKEKTFNHPTGVALDAGNNIWVADRLNNRIQKFTADGVLIDSATINTEISDKEHKHWNDHWGWWSLRKYERPGSIFIDNTDSLYVADQMNSRVLKYDVDGSFSMAVVLSTSAKTRAIPDAIFVDEKGRIYNKCTGREQGVPV